MLLELTFLEANQVIAALEDRLIKANDALPSLAEGSLEEGAVNAEIRDTGSVLARLQELAYGVDEPDYEPFTDEQYEQFQKELTPDEWTNREGMPEFNGTFR